MSQPRYLTKSRFKLAMECPTKLFYTNKKEYANQKLDDPFLRHLADGGFQVGKLARAVLSRRRRDRHARLRRSAKQNQRASQKRKRHDLRSRIPPRQFLHPCRRRRKAWRHDRADRGQGKVVRLHRRVRLLEQERHDQRELDALHPRRRISKVRRRTRDRHESHRAPDALRQDRPMRDRWTESKVSTGGG